MITYDNDTKDDDHGHHYDHHYHDIRLKGSSISTCSHKFMSELMRGTHRLNGQMMSLRMDTYFYLFEQISLWLEEWIYGNKTNGNKTKFLT